MLHKIIEKGCLELTAQVSLLRMVKKLLVLSLTSAHCKCMLEICAHYKLHIQKRPMLCSH